MQLAIRHRDGARRLLPQEVACQKPRKGLRHGRQRPGRGHERREEGSCEGLQCARHRCDPPISIHHRVLTAGREDETHALAGVIQREGREIPEGADLSALGSDQPDLREGAEREGLHQDVAHGGRRQEPRGEEPQVALVHTLFAVVHQEWALLELQALHRGCQRRIVSAHASSRRQRCRGLRAGDGSAEVRGRQQPPRCRGSGGALVLEVRRCGRGAGAAWHLECQLHSRLV
mmetsp:Transcript_88691/g.286548  ORF Transcript_88691/g.286548 Transcript_88691/m.286548 type:complete len:232 (-) Transcript_88691:271-966(-)